MTRTAIQQTERMRNLLAFLLIGAFISVLPVLTFRVIPPANMNIVTYMVGQLSGMALMVLGFYFVNKVGQDAADDKRADNTGKALEAITTVAQSTASAPAPPAPPNAAAAAQDVAGAAAERADEISGDAT